MASASPSLLKSSLVLDKSEWVKGQTLRQPSASVVRCSPTNPSALTIRAGSYADELVKTAKIVASPGRGILAMDESNATCGKRLASIGLENTEANRQAYRTLLVTVPGLGQYISGAILFEETLYQSTIDGKKIVDVLQEQKIVPGIKVDKGLVPLAGSNDESWCQGLDGLASRSAAYYQQGARFAKWRTVVSIPNGPTALAVKEAAWGLARYAAISQDNGLVPIVEPEILLDGEHTIDRTAPAPATRATRGRKAEEPAAAEEPETTEEAPKPAATRTRKIAAVKQAPAPKLQKAVVAEEPAVEEAPKATSRVRKAPVPVKKAPTTKKSEPATTEKTAVSEPAKPATRTRKPPVPKASASAPAPVIAPRATRGRNAPAVSQDSPLKAPARKPTKKAAAVPKTKAEPEAVVETAEEPVAEVVEEPVIEAVEEPIVEAVKEPLVEAVEEAVIEEAEEPVAKEIEQPVIAVADEPAIEVIEQSVVEVVEQPLAEFPGYPTTPTHISAPMTSREAVAELPGYPTTPSHIIAPLSNEQGLAELAGYPTTPAHITAPVVAAAQEHDVDVVEHEYNDVAMEDVEDNEPVEHSEACQVSTVSEAEEHVTTVVSGDPQHVEYPHIEEEEIREDLDATVDISIPAAKSHVTVQPDTSSSAAITVDDSTAEVVCGMTDQEAFEELPAAYPTTPTHISAPVTSKAALAELPDYPKTPAHIKAPMTPRRALAELPDYPTTPSLALEAALQEEITRSVKKQTPSPVRYPTLKNDSFELEEPSEIADISEVTEASEVGEIAVAHTAIEPSPFVTRPIMQLAPLKLAPTFAAPEPASPKKSALRSPQKVKDAKTPKKTVAWTDVQADESDLFLYDGILQGMVFYVDVTSNGREQNFLFRGLLEDLGAKVVQDISHASVSHVLFKDGSISTLEKCLESKGAIKCVNVGWVLDSESNKKRMDEEHYLVDLSVAKPATPLPTTAAKPFTPFKTPSKYALPPSSQCKMPSTPTSSEFDRSFNDDKENCEVGMFFDNDKSPLAPRTAPIKKSSFLFSRSAIKTPSKFIFLGATPSKPIFSAVKPAPQAATTVKKRPAESSFFGSLGPPKKLRLF